MNITNQMKLSSCDRQAYSMYGLQRVVMLGTNIALIWGMANKLPIPLMFLLLMNIVFLAMQLEGLFHWIAQIKSRKIRRRFIALMDLHKLQYRKVYVVDADSYIEALSYVQPSDVVVAIGNRVHTGYFPLGGDIGYVYNDPKCTGFINKDKRGTNVEQDGD